MSQLLGKKSALKIRKVPDRTLIDGGLFLTLKTTSGSGVVFVQWVVGQWGSAHSEDNRRW